MTIPLWLVITFCILVGIPLGLFLLLCLVVGFLIIIDACGFRL